jgi:hypothetical protein
MNVNASNAALRIIRFMDIASSLPVPDESFKTYSARIATASVENADLHTLNLIPWASGSCELQLMVFVWRRM